MAIANSPITLFAMEKSGPLGRLLAAGERLSNLAYHIATNKGGVDDRLRGEFDQCRRAWDDAAGEYAAVLRTKSDQPSGAGLIATERARQVSAEGWTPEHDDQHADFQLAQAARAYLWAARQTSIGLESERLPLDLPTANHNPWNGRALEAGSFAWPVSQWPWESSWWKPSDDPIRNLVKAGALIAAEIDRLQRLKEADASPSQDPITAAVDAQQEACDACPFRVDGINTTPENAAALIDRALDPWPGEDAFHPCHKTVTKEYPSPCRGAVQFAANVIHGAEHQGVFASAAAMLAAKTLGKDA